MDTVQGRERNAKVRLDRFRARNAQVVGDFAPWNLPYAHLMLTLDKCALPPSPKALPSPGKEGFATHPRAVHACTRN